MHLRGKNMKYIIRGPDRREETILSVPKFDFNWQLHYELEQPLKIKGGSTLICIAHYEHILSGQLPDPRPDIG